MSEKDVKDTAASWWGWSSGTPMPCTGVWHLMLLSQLKYQLKRNKKKEQIIDNKKSLFGTSYNDFYLKELTQLSVILN